VPGQMSPRETASPEGNRPGGRLVEGAGPQGRRSGLRTTWVQWLGSRSVPSPFAARSFRRDAAQRAARLSVPDPFDADEYIALLSRERGRPIRLIAMEMPPEGPWGALVSTPGADLVIYERRTSRPHRDHIIVHETMHLLMDDRTAPADQPGVMTPQESQRLFPDLDPRIVHQMLTPPPAV
jgi:hypothetical protein